MSPSSFGTNDEAHMLTMNLSGSIYNPNTDNVNNIYGIRPVINLRADVTLSGTGTSSDPYMVVGS